MKMAEKEYKGLLVSKRPVHDSKQVMNPRGLIAGRQYRWYHGETNELIEIVSTSRGQDVWIKHSGAKGKIESVRMDDMGIIPYPGVKDLWHSINYVVPAD